MDPNQVQMCKDVVFVFKDLCLAAAAITTAIVGAKGLATWKRQLRGNTEYELARRLSRATYKVRDAMAAVRNSSISPGEMVAALRAAGHAEEKIDLLKLGREADEAVYRERWKPLAQALSEFDVELLEAEVVWGAEIVQRRADLEACVNKLYRSIQRYAREMRKPGRLHDQELEGLERVIWAGYPPGEVDHFEREIQAAVSKLTSFLKQHLKL